MSTPAKDIERFEGRVAIVTGAGRGLGREYALALAARGARVVVNGRGTNGGASEDEVVDEIRAAGGEAIHIAAPVTDRRAVGAMVDDVLGRWGRIDLLVNNAGFVRDRSFAKLDLDDFQAVLDVHLMGAATVTHAVWPHMLERRYGRIVMIVSSSGLAGNFGQAAYAAAKMGLVGLMNTLGLEGGPKNVLVNCFSPVGITAMNEAVMPAETHAMYSAERAVPGCLFLLTDGAPSRTILLGGGGAYERAYVPFTRGAAMAGGSIAEIARRFAEISDRRDDVLPESAQTQMDVELALLRRSRPSP